LDLLGPLPPAQGNLKYVVVVVKYFSKWIKSKAFGYNNFGHSTEILLAKHRLSLWRAEGYHR
jgi:hypothetical protein